MIEAKNLTRTFKNGDILTRVLKGIDLKVAEGEFVAIMGRSGAGKSTLMYQLSLLDEPSGGEVIIDGKNTETMSTNEKTAYRLSQLGYVFQEYALLPELTALENVVVPLLMLGFSDERARKVAAEALERVGLGKRLDNLPSQLSGGEQQRVSISRAIANHPKVLFADEPTANLDNESARTVMKLFLELHQEGQTIIMVTHEEEFGRMAQKIIRLDDGKIVRIDANRQ